MNAIEPTGEPSRNREAPEDFSLPLREYWGIVRKRLWTILAVLGLVAGLATLYMVNQPNVYRATTIVEIRTNQNRILSDVEPVVDPAGGARYWSTREFYETQYRIIRSRAVAQQVVTALQLGQNLDFLGLSQESDPDVLSAAMEHIDPVSRLMQMMTVEPVEDSYLVEISVDHTDPELATLLANTIAEVFVERNLEQQLQGTNDAFEWLEAERTQLRDRVGQAEQALLGFRQDNDLHDSSLTARRDNLSRQASEVAARLNAVREELSQIRSEQREVRRALDSDTPTDVPLPAVIDNSLIQNLKQQREQLADELERLQVQYGENQHEVRGLTRSLQLVEEAIVREIGTVLESYDTRLAGVQAREHELSRQQEDLQSALVALSQAEPEYNQLDRDIQIDTHTLQIIEQRHKDVDLYRRQQNVNNIQVLDAAIVPARPVRPNRPQIAFIAALLGLVLGIGFAFLQEILDNTIKTQEDVEKVLGVTFLGVVPSIKGRFADRRRPAGLGQSESRSRDLYIHHNPKSTVAETCRAIRTNLQFMTPDRPLRRILVTSAGPREGKTSTAVNLATVMAQADRRVLLVDTDMRKPRLHRIFQIDDRLGLTNLLLGEISEEQAIHHTEIPNLDVIPCGSIPPNPTELMNTERFRTVVGSLAGHYERIIFDSPPIIAVADSMVLATMSDGVVVVIKAGQTSTEIVKRATQMLLAIKAPLLGAILNDLDLEDRAYRYHHYYSYYYHYGQYYEQSGAKQKPDPETGKAAV